MKYIVKSSLLFLTPLITLILDLILIVGITIFFNKNFLGSKFIPYFYKEVIDNFEKIL